jgi:hypothetical protein
MTTTYPRPAVVDVCRHVDAGGWRGYVFSATPLPGRCRADMPGPTGLPGDVHSGVFHLHGRATGAT